MNEINIVAISGVIDVVVDENKNLVYKLILKRRKTESGILNTISEEEYDYTVICNYFVFDNTVMKLLNKSVTVIGSVLYDDDYGGWFILAVYIINHDEEIIIGKGNKQTNYELKNAIGEFSELMND